MSDRETVRRAAYDGTLESALHDHNAFHALDGMIPWHVLYPIVVGACRRAESLNRRKRAQRRRKGHGR